MSGGGMSSSSQPLSSLSPFDERLRTIRERRDDTRVLPATTIPGGGGSGSNHLGLLIRDDRPSSKVQRQIRGEQSDDDDDDEGDDDDGGGEEEEHCETRGEGQERRRQCTDNVVDGAEVEYTSARRAASEAILVGRATAESVSHQGEQIARADELADEQRYMIDRAERLLRGRTWRGWVANMFTSDPSPPSASASDSAYVSSYAARYYPAQPRGGERRGEGRKESLGASWSEPSADDFEYRDVPAEFSAASRIVADYRRHVRLVLPACSTPLQQAACREVCGGLARRAGEELRILAKSIFDDNKERWAWYNVLVRDKGRADEELREAVSSSSLSLYSSSRPTTAAAAASVMSTSQSSLTPTATVRPPSFASASAVASPFVPNTALALKAAAQDDHLSALSSDLAELGGIGSGLGGALDGQNEALDVLMKKADELEDGTRRIVRKADRLAERAQYKKTPAEFKEFVTVRHLKTGLHLGCPDDGGSVPKLRLYHRLDTVWEVWTRRGDIVGLKNRRTGKWLGLSMMGHVVCSATKFGRSEEWEFDVGSRLSTRLLCASANWGAGGWLDASRANGDDDDAAAKLSIGAYGVDAGRMAARWKVLVHED